VTTLINTLAEALFIFFCAAVVAFLFWWLALDSEDIT
jgi:hypothetical protein